MNRQEILYNLFNYDTDIEDDIYLCFIVYCNILNLEKEYRTELPTIVAGIEMINDTQIQDFCNKYITENMKFPCKIDDEYESIEDILPLIVIE